ncbi:epoxyqueuosine reductase [Desulfococcaceae bacterium HSG8]|nr:epoxyqueuosine reductase [Desulfococcaceae bacterium HSG8]
MDTQTACSKIEGIVRDFITESPENTLCNRACEKAFENPLVGFSKGDDPLYDAYKKHVGEFHWTPKEVFTTAFPELSADPGELTVVSWILPQTKATKTDNRKQQAYPSERWARSRVYGEIVNEKLRSHLVNALQKEGYPAAAPALLPQWERKTSETYGFASTWSERHAAFASGLGTFGLCDGLITPRGKAMRTGSVIVKIRTDPAPRPYKDHHEYCLFFTKGVCGKCISRCPAGAITHAGKDKVRCSQYIRSEAAEFVKSNYGFDGYGCGLCQTAVPCESGIPVKQEMKS